MRTRNNYWTNTKFADWIRGTPKPSAATFDEWDDWKIAARKKHPLRMWIADDFLGWLQDFLNWIPDKLYDIKYYIVNRWVSKSHSLTAHSSHVKPGQWIDLSDRMLYCLFDELVDFVEIEKAYSNYRWNEEKQKGMKWWQVGKWRLRTWRSPEAGIDYLKWEMTLTDEDWLPEDKKHEAKLTPQALDAKEILDLYTWWTTVYPNRKDVHDESGWSDICDKRRERGISMFSGDETDKEESKIALDRIAALEKAYKDEDTEMLVRLIKVRDSLWT